MNEYFLTLTEESTSEISYFTATATPVIGEILKEEEDIFQERFKDYTVSRSGTIIEEYDIR
jgi:hypothetical protein